MLDTICAVCQKNEGFKVLYEANFRPQDINPKTYTSRRIPDKVHFRIVRCKVCGLTFSNPIYDPSKVIDAYKKSSVPTMEDIENSAKVYISYLKPLIKYLPSCDNLLDIGCGNGFFLKEVKKLGFKQVYGVEPSREAVSQLVPGIEKKNVTNDVFKKGQFKKNFFDIICFFQVLDHVVDPNEFLENCYKILKPGGYILAIMHDAKSITHQILGEKSPIFDVQHIYLFGKQTLKKIFENNGFVVPQVFNILNYYSLGYWLEMAPLPNFVKKFAQQNKGKTPLKIVIPLKIGNMAIIAKKKQ